MRFAEREARDEAVRTLEDVTQRVHGEYVKHLAALEQALALARSTPSGQAADALAERLLALETETAHAKEDARRATRRAEAVEQQVAAGGRAARAGAHRAAPAQRGRCARRRARSI